MKREFEYDTGNRTQGGHYDRLILVVVLFAIATLAVIWIYYGYRAEQLENKLIELDRN